MLLPSLLMAFTALFTKKTAIEITVNTTTIMCKTDLLIGRADNVFCVVAISAAIVDVSAAWTIAAKQI